jgi:hypothetical protein
MPGKLTNFTIEFWLKTSQETREFTLSIASKGVDLNYKGQQKLLVSVGKDNTGAVELPRPLTSWTHIALVYSQKSSLKVYVNAQLAWHCKQKVASIPCPHPMPLLRLSSKQPSPQLHCEITELRMWSCCLNKAIIGDNYNVPLTLLYEKKRRLRVEIQKKKKDFKGLGKLGGNKAPGFAQKF